MLTHLPLVTSDADPRVSPSSPLVYHSAPDATFARAPWACGIMVS